MIPAAVNADRNLHPNAVVKNAEHAALLLRVSLGAMFVAHGLLKVFVFTLPGTVAFFASQGFPGWTAYVVVAMEVIGGAALILGFRTRLVAAALLPVLLGAVFVHLSNGWLFTAQGGGWEYPMFLAAATVVQILLGDGAYAVGRRPASVDGTGTGTPVPGAA